LCIATVGSEHRANNDSDAVLTSGTNVYL